MAYAPPHPASPIFSQRVFIYLYCSCLATLAASYYLALAGWLGNVDARELVWRPALLLFIKQQNKPVRIIRPAKFTIRSNRKKYVNSLDFISAYAIIYIANKSCVYRCRIGG